MTQTMILKIMGNQMKNNSRKLPSIPSFSSIPSKSFELNELNELNEDRVQGDTQ